MELRRLGMAQKPAVVVPNHMLEQFSREWMQAYPQARILAAGDRGPGPRQAPAARRPDRHRRLGRRHPVPLGVRADAAVGPQAQQAYLDTPAGQLRRPAGERPGRPRADRQAAGRQRWPAPRSGSRSSPTATEDPGITFEQTGIDYLCVDEAHGYKNLRTVSNIPGVGDRRLPAGLATWT